MQRELRLFLIALQFFTRVPVTGRLAAWAGWSEPAMNDSARYFPLVGALVGGVGAGVYLLAVALWPPLVAVLLSVAATMWLTGAFHEDGWADTCDALGGQVSRERALEIMKDSRLGTYGVAGLILMLGLKVATMAHLPAAVVAITLVMAHSVSRAAVVALSGVLPYGGDAQHAKAKPLARQVRPASVVVALACAGALLLVWALMLSCAVPALWPTMGAGGWCASGSPAVSLGTWPTDRMGLAMALVVVILAIAGTVTLACARLFLRRLGGYTGDTLGAAQQAVELGIYLAVLAIVTPGAGA